MINMMQIWKQQIDEIQEMILDTEIGKDGKLMQLSNKQAALNLAFLRVLKGKI